MRPKKLNTKEGTVPVVIKRVIQVKGGMRENKKRVIAPQTATPLIRKVPLGNSRYTSST
jgi:hypothetical protein